MKRTGLALLVYSLASASLASAQTIITSDTPEAISITIYRAPERGQNPISADWPEGYALITETRNIRIPAGDAVIRFEGVAEGMFPESAIVSGLPSGLREKNRDARLLSPQGLVDAYLKRAVSITRTNKKTGKSLTQNAMITAGPNGGVILQTGEGYEALRCTGLPERMTFGAVPAGLSAKPTLSVLTTSKTAITAKLTLTYMAAGFDWQANYIAQVKDRNALGKGKVDLFAWLTIANGGNQSFLNANTMAIAGSPKREERGDEPRPTGGDLVLECWPMQRTHEVPYHLGYMPMPPPPPPSPEAYYDKESATDSIIVTAQKRSRGMLSQSSPVSVIVAEQEDLGDLKLYRIPEPVTVNAKGQKQVALLVQPSAAFTHIYYANVEDMDAESHPMQLLLRGENLKKEGLGLPMPSGQVLIYEDSSYGPLIVSETQLTDRAIGDEVELSAGLGNDVRIAVTPIGEQANKRRFKVEVSNARSVEINVEVEIPYKLRGKPKAIVKIDGMPTWKIIVPANSEATLFYELNMDRNE
jgi:hypothetical protein